MIDRTSKLYNRNRSSVFQNNLHLNQKSEQF